MWSVKSCQFNQQSAQSQAVQIISGPLQNDNIMNSVVFIGPHSSGNSKHYKQLLVDVPSIIYIAFIAGPIRNLQWASDKIIPTEVSGPWEKFCSNIKDSYWTI